MFPDLENKKSVLRKPIYMEELERHLEGPFVDNDNTDTDEKHCIRTEGAHEHDFVQIAASNLEKDMDRKRIIRCLTCNSVFCEICGKLIMK